MPKTKSDQPTEYRWPHPRFITSKDKEWLQGRLKHPTGFCSQYNPLDLQGHEGTKPKSRAGHPLPICTFSETCPCTCHKEIDDMYALAGIERPPAEQNPDYAELSGERHLVTQAMLDSLVADIPISAPLSSIGDPVGHPGDEDDAPANVDGPRGTPARTFTPTPTGRRARGQLEYDVLTVCIDFAAGVFEWPICTPKCVSEEIGKRHAIEPPSTGAINAVWDRWERLDFATQDKKPSRFVKFNVDNPSPQVLDAIKARTKREKRRSLTEQKRGTLRPRSR